MRTSRFGRIAAFLGFVAATFAGLPGAAHAQGYPGRADEHQAITSVRASVWGWWTPAEKERLESIDTAHTKRGRRRLLARLAADRAVRVLAPLALEASDHPADAAKLRALAPIRDRRSERAARTVLRTVAQPWSAPLQPLQLGPLSACDAPISWAQATVALPRPPYPTAAVAAVACAAVRVGADRAVVVDAVLELVRTMASAARAPGCLTGGPGGICWPLSRTAPVGP